MKKSINKILIIRSGAIGDVIMTTPLVAGIRKRFPEALISYLVGFWSTGAIIKNKDIDDIIFFDDQIIFNNSVWGVSKLIYKLRKMGFDLCFILDKSYLWNTFAFFCGIPQRYGFSRDLNGFPNTKSVPFDGSKHELEYYSEVGRLLDINIDNKKLKLNKDRKFVDQFIKNNKIRGKIIGIGAGGAKNPGQEAPVKRWPKQRYIQLINRLSYKYNIVLFGGPSDKKINQYILRSIKKSKKQIISAIDNTIYQSAALIDKCVVFITHDSGALHIASTTTTKIVALFGPTDPKRFAPRKAIVIKSNLGCSPCYDVYGKYKKCKLKNCMNMSIDEVYNIIKNETKIKISGKK